MRPILYSIILGKCNLSNSWLTVLLNFRMGIRMLADDEHEISKSYWFHTILIALVISICFNITILSYRYFVVIRQEKLDRAFKVQENAKEVWYLEKEMLKKDVDKKKKGK